MTEQDLKDLQGELIKVLLERLRNGSITAQEMSVARALLRDNNIQVLPQANPELLKLADAIPMFDRDGQLTHKPEAV